jgi:LysM repeat protein
VSRIQKWIKNHDVALKTSFATAGLLGGLLLSCHELGLVTFGKPDQTSAAVASATAAAKAADAAAVAANAAATKSADVAAAVARDVQLSLSKMAIQHAQGLTVGRNETKTGREKVHVVSRGEVLCNTAKRYGLDANLIIAKNDLIERSCADPRSTFCLMEGQRLAMPIEDGTAVVRKRLYCS